MSKRLARYASEGDAIKALISAQDKISSGTLKTALPEAPTPEELKSWREDNGIPDTPEAYGVKLPEGATDEDKAVIGEFAKAAHEMNLTPSQLNAAVAWQRGQAEAAQEAQSVKDAGFKEAGDEELRKEWGSEFKLNRNMILGLLDGAPEGTRDQFLGGRLADGARIGDDPNVLRWLANLAREVNPVATVVGHGTNQAQTIQTEMATLEKLMGDRTSEYWKGPSAQAHQERYRQLLTAKEKVSR
jgi:uncharacterized protein YukE